jgi:NAD(P)-dependent dehydrogenase (short-subunit alcohol dehydrogenase family)
MFTAGVRAHLATSRRAIPLMLPQQRGLIITTTATLDGTGEASLGNLYYDLAKHAVSRLVWSMARELRDHHIASVALAPGFMRTERVVEAFTRAGYRAALEGPGGPTETTTYIGRAVVALVTDPNVMNKTGRLLEVGLLAQEYGFTDVNGMQPPPFRLPA